MARSLHRRRPCRAQEICVGAIPSPREPRARRPADSSPRAPLEDLAGPTFHEPNFDASLLLERGPMAGRSCSERRCRRRPRPRSIARLRARARQNDRRERTSRCPEPLASPLSHDVSLPRVSRLAVPSIMDTPHAMIEDRETRIQALAGRECAVPACRHRPIGDAAIPSMARVPRDDARAILRRPSSTRPPERPPVGKRSHRPAGTGR